MSDDVIVEDGALTVVFKYDNFDDFRKLPIYEQVFEMMKAGMDQDPPVFPPIRVSCIAHYDINTRMDCVEKVMALREQHTLDPYDVMSTIEDIIAATTDAEAEAALKSLIEDEDA